MASAYRRDISPVQELAACRSKGPSMSRRTLNLVVIFTCIAIAVLLWLGYSQLGAAPKPEAALYPGEHLYPSEHIYPASPDVPISIPGIVVLVLFLFVGLGYFHLQYRDDKLWGGTVAVVGLWLVSTVVFVFAFAYYHDGLAYDFTPALNKGHALFLALGTLTTGAPGITPRTSDARGLMMVQMATDLIIITFVVGLTLDRLTRGRREQTASPSEQSPPGPQRPSSSVTK